MICNKSYCRLRSIHRQYSCRVRRSLPTVLASRRHTLEQKSSRKRPNIVYSVFGLHRSGVLRAILTRRVRSITKFHLRFLSDGLSLHLSESRCTRSSGRESSAEHSSYGRFHDEGRALEPSGSVRPSQSTGTRLRRPTTDRFGSRRESGLDYRVATDRCPLVIVFLVSFPSPESCRRSSGRHVVASSRWARTLGRRSL